LPEENQKTSEKTRPGGLQSGFEEDIPGISVGCVTAISTHDCVWKICWYIETRVERFWSTHIFQIRSLVTVFIYGTYKAILAKLITVEISYFTTKLHLRVFR